jgi:hypothetical protein
LGALLVCGFAAAVAAAKPELVLPPEVSGEVRAGGRLVCSSGEWKGAPKFEYEWVREGVVFQVGSGVSSTYTLNPAKDEHKEIWCIVKATQSSESARAESINAVCLGGNCHTEPPVPPSVEVLPEVTGTPAVGKTLTCVPGKWAGKPAPVFAYKWLRDKAEPIASATANTYAVAAEDETHELTCRVVAQNEGGEAAAESKNGLKIPGTEPKNASRPEVVGPTGLGETLTCNAGTWGGSKPLTFAFQWLRNGGSIAGATGPTHIVEKLDEGQLLSCRVVAKNALGSAEATSETKKIERGKLESTGAPVIEPSGSVTLGTTLKCSVPEGSWNQSNAELTFEYEWLRDGSGLVKKASTYPVVSADQKHLISCQVTAKNKAGGSAATAVSSPVSVVEPNAQVPVIMAGPSITGPQNLGGTLSCENVWSNNPTTTTYQWLRQGVEIKFAATSETYKVVAADQGRILTCRVIAKNAAGFGAPAESEPPGAFIQGIAPSNTAAPEIQGPAKPRAGDSLTCVRGAWAGTPEPEYEYAWLSDGVPASEYSPIGYTYQVLSGDRGHALTCRVKAANKPNADKVPVAVTADSGGLHVQGFAPEAPLGGPTIGGEAAVGGTLTCQPGGWTGAPAPSFEYQWFVNNNPIAGETGQAYQVGGSARGFNISCRVTGKNSEGEGASLSKPVHVQGEPPAPIQLPFLSGTPSVGFALICERGIWRGKPPPSFKYVWFRDGAQLSAAAEKYTVEAADQGHVISCNVIASNSEGSLEEESTNALLVSARSTTTTGPGGTGGTVKKVIVTPAIVLASLKRQLLVALEHAHIKSLLKTHRIWFSFTPPSGGKLEMTWLLTVKGAHGAKAKQLVLAQVSSSFTSAKKHTLKMNLTMGGRRLLTGKRHVSVKAKATFTIGKAKPVTTSMTYVLAY